MVIRKIDFHVTMAPKAGGDCDRVGKALEAAIQLFAGPMAGLFGYAVEQFGSAIDV
jgi:hypothetical protein